jgi:hypothetical protein
MNLEKLKEQKNEYSKKWYHRNKNEVKISQAKYRLENREKISKKGKENRIKNKDKIKVMRREYYLKNKEHILAKKKTWSSNNKDRLREYQLKTQYNLTLDQYNKMLSDQNNSCKVCDIKFNINIKPLTPHVDHCHATSKVRGLLCMNCNASLGQLKEDTKIMQKLIEYVKEHNNE